MEGDVCTADESEGWSPYFLLDVEIFALILAGRLVGKGGESSPFSLSRLSRELRGGTRQKIGLQERPTFLIHGFICLRRLCRAIG